MQHKKTDYEENIESLKLMTNSAVEVYRVSIDKYVKFLCKENSESETTAFLEKKNHLKMNIQLAARTVITFISAVRCFDPEYQNLDYHTQADRYHYIEYGDFEKKVIRCS